MNRVHITSTVTRPGWGPADARCTCGWGILRVNYYHAIKAEQGHRFDVLDAGESVGTPQLSPSLQRLSHEFRRRAIREVAS